MEHSPASLVNVSDEKIVLIKKNKVTYFRFVSRSLNYLNNQLCRSMTGASVC